MRNRILKSICLLGIIGLSVFSLFFFKNSLNLKAATLITKNETYHEVLATGIRPALAPDYEFPTSFQYLNGCYGFAVGHILMDRGYAIDMLEMEKRIEKPREKLWEKQYKKRLAEVYDLELKYYKDPKYLFELLTQGEAVVIGYQYPLEDEKWILHAVAAYSFDDVGFWISETMSGQRKRVPYEKVFTEKGDETQYRFTQVINKTQKTDNLLALD